jgi:hypothetical protein
MYDQDLIDSNAVIYGGCCRKGLRLSLMEFQTERINRAKIADFQTTSPCHAIRVPAPNHR